MSLNETYNASLWIKGGKNALIKASQTNIEPKLVGVLAEYVPSSANKESYPWIGEAHAMKLLKDELEYFGLTDALYEVENETYAIALPVARNHLRDDQLGGIMERVRQMALVALNFPNKLIIDAITNATSLLGYDGVSYYNNAHPIRGVQTATQDNLLGGTGVTSSALRTDLTSAIASLGRFVGENGEPFAASRSRFVDLHPVELMMPMNEAIYPAVYAQTTNVLFKGLEIMPFTTARLTDTNDHYVFDVSSGLPLIYQEERPVNVEFLGEGSDHWVKHEQAIFKISWRGAVGYKHWAHSVKLVNS